MHQEDPTCAEVQEEIRTRVSQELARGRYEDPRIAHAEIHHVDHLLQEGVPLRYLARCLRAAAWVDTGDFAIRDRRGGLTGWVFSKLKARLWTLLRFANNRLWSQQNRVNRHVVDALMQAWQDSRQRIEALEARLDLLEHRTTS